MGVSFKVTEKKIYHKTKKIAVEEIKLNCLYENKPAQKECKLAMKIFEKKNHFLWKFF